jgi:peroxiredoxin
MDAWGKDLKVEDKITMFADPQGNFIKELGLGFDASGMEKEKSLWRG